MEVLQWIDYGIDPELLAQGPGLDQQDLLIQLLRKQAMEGVQSPQGQMVSGHYIAPNILSHIAAAMQPRQKMAQADAMQKEAISEARNASASPSKSTARVDGPDAAGYSWTSASTAGPRRPH